MELSIPSIKGMALDKGTERSFLPFMHSLALNAGPGGTKSGRRECTSITALAWSRSGPAADAGRVWIAAKTLLARAANIRVDLRDMDLSDQGIPSEAIMVRGSADSPAVLGYVRTNKRK